MANVAVIEAALRLDGKQWDRTINRAKANFQKLVTDTKAIAAAAGTILLGAGIGLAKVAGELKEAGDEALRLKKNLDTTFDGEQLDRLTEKIRVLGATPPFSEEQFTGAAKQLATFGKEVESNLDRIGNIAAFTGQNFDTISKAFAGLGVDDRAAKQLEKLANISPERLAQYGAVLDKTGEKLDLTGDNAEKAQKALEALADAEFAGAMDQAVTATDQLSGSLLLLKQDAGAALAEFADSAASFIVPLVEGFRALPGPVKASVGVIVALGSAAAVTTAGVIALGLAAGPIGAAFTAAGGAAGIWASGLAAVNVQLPILNQSLLGVAGSVAILGGAMAVIIGLFVATTNAINEQTKAEEQLLKIELRRAANQRTLGDLQGKSIEQLKAEGKTADDLANGILALQERIELAREAGNDALVKRLSAQVVDLKKAKEELAKAETVQRQRAKEEEVFNSPEAKAAREKDAAEKDKLRKEALDKELDDISLRLAQEEISQRESLRLRAEALQKYRADESEKRALAIETAKFETQTATEAVKTAEERKEALRSGRLDNRLNEIKLLRTQEKISAQEEIASLERILQTYDLTESEKQQLRQQTADLEARLRDERERAEEKAAQEEQRRAEEAVKQAEKNAQDLAAAKAEGNRLEQDSISRQIDDLQAQTEDTGQNNTGKIRALIEEQLKLQLEAIALEAEREKAATDSAEARAQIEANANEKMKAAIRGRADEEKRAVQEQIDAINDLNEAKKPKKESSFSGPFGLEDLNASIQSSLNTTSALRSAEVQTGGFSQLQLLAEQIQAQPDKEVRLPRDYQPQIKGDLDLKVSVDVKGDAEVKTVASTSVDGKQSSIMRSGRGMRGRVGLA